jgi:hypothetical protein
MNTTDLFSMILNLLQQHLPSLPPPPQQEQQNASRLPLQSNNYLNQQNYPITPISIVNNYNYYNNNEKEK